MFRRAISNGGGGVVTAMLAAFALVMQLLLTEPCAQAEAHPIPAAAHAHCEDAASTEASAPKKAPATAADFCCKCVAPSVAPPPALQPAPRRGPIS